MNNRHLVDSAIFATAYAGAAPGERQRAQLESFIQSDLMPVVDEVFEQVDGRLPGAAAVLRLERLEVDLGEIDFSDYRRQLPARLRVQLLQALDDLRREPGAATAGVDLTDTAGARRAQLLLFLSNGYLPWYARVGVEAVDGLDDQLTEALEQSPEIILGFLRTNADRAGVLERLARQFSPRSLRQVERRLAATRDTAARQVLARLRKLRQSEQQEGDAGRRELRGQMPGDAAAGDAARPTGRQVLSAAGHRIDRLQRRLVSALRSESAASIESAWQVLYRGHRHLLRQTLRYYGQAASVRARIAAEFSDAMRGELLELLEPEARPLLSALLSATDIFAAHPGESGTARAPSIDDIWAYSLGYLLVERGARFDARAYLHSVVRQIAAATGDTPARLSAGLERKLQALDEAEKHPAWSRLPVGPVDATETGDAINGLLTAYRRFGRIERALTREPAERPRPAPDMVTDIRALRHDTPWLLRRLQRELQSGDDGWLRASAGLPAAVLEELCYALLAQNEQADAARPYGAATELVSAIRRQAASAADRGKLFAYLLERLVDEELIDLEAVDVQSPRPGAAGAGAARTARRGEREADADDISVTALQALAKMGPQPRVELLRCAELLTTAVYATGAAPPAERLQRIKWRFVRDYAGETGYLFNQRFFARRYVEHLMQQLRPGDSARFRALLVRGLRRDSLPATRESTRQLIEIIEAETDDTPRYIETADALPAVSDDTTLPLENIYIDNAGLVLLAPYLPTLFERLGLLEAGEFIDRDAAERAVHCLQYLVNAQLESPEYRLVLNKLLCGVRPGLPICRGIEIDAATRAQLDDLLRAVTQNWTPLQNTSIDGLRESFLQRGGRLQLHDDAWRLAVEARPFDMLLDQLPWSYGTIKFAWMERVIHVEWR